MSSQLDLGTVIVVVIGVVTAVVLLVSLTATSSRRGRPVLPTPDTEPRGVPVSERSMPLPAVVINPSKFDDDGAEMRSVVTAQCRRHGWAEPLWLETTVDDPGSGQAREALEKGAGVVMACGGDGTVRAVGEELAGTDVPLGLLPAGTGNLLARNLDMELDHAARAIEIALTGDNRRVDVGRITVGEDAERVFLVMAGMGFDADVMSNAPEKLKARVGPAAYAVAGLQRLNGPRTKVRVEVGDGTADSRRVRAVIIGNCGKLLGGLELMPDAEVDDGLLDVVSIAPKGIIGWANVAASVVTRHRKGHATMERWRGKTVEVHAETPMEAELDGDPVGEATVLKVRVDPGALVVKVSSWGSASDPAPVTERDLTRDDDSTEVDAAGHVHVDGDA